MKLADQSGHTLVEIIIASMLIGMVFLMVASLYLSALKFLRSEVASPSVNSLLALETMARDVSVANDGIVDANGLQVKIRIDTNDPATATAADDKWVSYRFLDSGSGARLRSRTVNPPNASPADVTASDPEVVTGLAVLAAAGQSSFQLINPTAQGAPTVVQVRLVVSGEANAEARTFLTSVAVKSSK